MRAAMMKSNGEQLAGQAVRQGFSSQYSQRCNSTCRRFLLMNGEAASFLFSMANLGWGREIVDYFCVV
jgi:hypothetical protein